MRRIRLRDAGGALPRLHANALVMNVRCGVLKEVSFVVITGCNDKLTEAGWLAGCCGLAQHGIVCARAGDWEWQQVWQCIG